MALEQHNTAFEFETMLRRHLSAGGSTVEACAGFDADTASAYLEDAVGPIARSRYESHLAECLSCRRQIIELSQLINLPQVMPQTEPQAEPQVAPGAQPVSIGSRWKVIVDGWVDRLNWSPARNWGWTMAGAAAALLLGVMATSLWRQSRQAEPTNIAYETRRTAPSQAEGDSVSVAQVPDSVAGVPSMAAGSDTETKNHLTPTPIPAPEKVLPLQGDENFANTLAARVDSESAKKLGAASQPVLLGGSGNPLPPASTSNVGPVFNSLSAVVAGGQIASNINPQTASESVAAPPESDKARIIAPINTSPNDNPMTRARRGAKQESTPSVLKNGFSFMPSPNADTDRKAELKEIEEGAPRLLTVRVRDKVFSFQSGLWVDHAYKPDMAWRMTKLVRGSDEYNQIVAAEPQLKEFFERGAVIVVWKDKIYKVGSK